MTIPRQRTYSVDSRITNRLVTEAGLTIDELAGNPRFRLGKKTVRKLLRGQAVYMSSIREFARFFAVDVADILLPDPSRQQPSVTVVGDWRIVSALGAVEEAANGLQFRRYKLCRNDDPNVLARGKRYFLDHLSLVERTRVQEHLLRHTNVCNQVGLHPNIAHHYEIKSDVGENLWWVIDEWIPGNSLEVLLRERSLECAELRRVMADAAGGLRALHDNRVVLRQLSPASIVIHSERGRAVLIDFEMAKLFGRRPTVAPDDRWPDDDYRAPEIGGTTCADPSADIYSWARVFLHACTGHAPPPPGQDLELLEKLGIPRFVRLQVATCLAIDRRRRPRNVKQIIRTLRRWKNIGDEES